MTFKRNGGILFISAFGCSLTFARKRFNPAPRFSRNPVKRVRQMMVQEEADTKRISVRLVSSAFAISAAFFAASVATIF